MSKIPKDVDDLMWLAAESGNPQAVRDFGNRFPHLRGELLKRVQMVSEFKKAGSRGPASPVFRSEAPRGRMPSRNAMTLAFSAIAAAAGILVVFGAMILFRPKLSPPPSMGQTVVTGASTSGGVVYRGAAPQAGQSAPVDPPRAAGGQIYPQSPPGSGSPPNGYPNAGSGSVPALGTAPSASGSTPISIALKGADLRTAMQLLSLQAKLKIQLAPGMMNPEVDFQYQDTSPDAILQDMGRKYGFTSLYQGDDFYILVPVRDSGGKGTDGGPGTGTNPDTNGIKSVKVNESPTRRH